MPFSWPDLTFKVLMKFIEQENIVLSCQQTPLNIRCISFKIYRNDVGMCTIYANMEFGAFNIQ